MTVTASENDSDPGTSTNSVRDALALVPSVIIVFNTVEPDIDLKRLKEQENELAQLRTKYSS